MRTTPILLLFLAISFGANASEFGSSQDWTTKRAPELYYLAPDVGGETYSAVVDCGVQCPVDAVSEGEPTLTDGYLDAHNGGCNSPEFGSPFQRIDWTNDDDGLPPYGGSAWICGTSGWYQGEDASTHRDTDWFVATALESGVMEFTVESDYPCKIAHINVQDCSSVSGYQNTIVDCGTPGTLSIQVEAGDEVHLWVGPTEFSGPVREFQYFGTLTNNVFDVVPVDGMSWGSLKSQYR